MADMERALTAVENQDMCPLLRVSSWTRRSRWLVASLLTQSGGGQGQISWPRCNEKARGDGKTPRNTIRKCILCGSVEAGAARVRVQEECSQESAKLKKS